jgi:hypothetical protein
MTDAEDSGAEATDADRPAADIRIVSTSASAADVAAVTAVLRGALAEHAAGLELAAGDQVSAWARSQRPIRRAIAPGRDAWRGFAG